MRRNVNTLFVVAALAWAALAVQGPASAGPVEHGVVYFEEGRFAGWPANNGIWAWGNEVVVGFTLGHYKDNKGGHAIDRDRPSAPRQCRSLDGGASWTLEIPSYLDADGRVKPAQQCPGNVEFTHPDFAARFRSGQWFYSLDRCHTWQGPFGLPGFGRKGLLARTDYIVEGRGRLTAFIATEKDGGGEGWPCAIRTEDGGKTWSHVGWIGRQPPAGYGYAIMPATVALDGGGYFSMIRRGGRVDNGKAWWLEAFVSPNEGRSWYLLDQPRIDNGGNPATLNRLADGRLALAYGWRHAPYGLRARVSNDDGQTWGPEVVLRDDGASWDIGYPRTIQRPDGKCLTCYYFHHPDNPERYIAYTLWEPGWTEAFAARIHDAHSKRAPMPQLSAYHAEATLAHGYAIQQAFAERAFGKDGLGGFKAAVVGASGQENLGVDGPITGVIPASGILDASDNVVIDLADDPHRHLETEIGYLFDRAVTKPLRSAAFLKHFIGAVAPIIEVPGGATDDKHPATAADLAAWNGNARALIVGERHEPRGLDVDAIPITLVRDGETINIAESGQAAGGQWETLLKTVNNLVERGYTIQPGHVITNGALGNVHRAQPGAYQADFGPLGTIAFTVKAAG